MKLLRLAYGNFKAQSFEIAPMGGDLVVYGDNETGKTTMQDAQLWLLTGKDSHGRVATRTGFSIKDTRVEDGEALNGVDHWVEGVYEFDGGKVATLKKVYREEWGKTRGSARSEMKGNTVDHYWNDVKLETKGDFEKKLEEAIGLPMKVLRKLLDVHWFNCGMKWEERRTDLLEMSGDVAQEDVIAAEPKLAALLEILGPHTIDEYRSKASGSQTAINKQLAEIRPRIDENTRLASAELSPAPSAEEVEALRAKLDTLRQDRVTILTGGATAVKMKDLAECQAEIQQHLNRVNASGGDEIARLAEHLRNKRQELRTNEDTVARVKADVSSSEQRTARLDERRAQLLEEYGEINARTFEFSGNDTCAACLQPLPAEKVKAARDEAEAIFNQKKSQDLERNIQAGAALKPDRERETAENETRRGQIEAGEAQATKLKAEVEEAERTLSSAESAKPEPLSDPDYIAAMDRKRILEDDVKKLQEGTIGSLDSKDAEIEAVQKQVLEADLAIAKASQAKVAETRIAELKAQETQLAEEFEKLEGHMFLTDLFVRTWTKMLTEKINTLFGVARFQLFENQQNGGIAVCCETLVNGVPYSSNLNQAGKTNVGIDIVNALSKHYGFVAPVFVDQCESVTSVLPSAGQQIRLIVMEGVKPLTTDHEVAKAQHDAAVAERLAREAAAITATTALKAGA